MCQSPRKVLKQQIKSKVGSLELEKECIVGKVQGLRHEKSRNNKKMQTDHQDLERALQQSNDLNHQMSQLNEQMEQLKRKIESARIREAKCKEIVSVNQSLDDFMTKRMNEALTKQGKNSKQLCKLKNLLIALKNDRIQINQQMSLEDALSEYQETVKSASKKLQVSFGSIRSISDFIQKEEWIKLQRVNKYFYETAVSRVQTRIKSDQQKRNEREVKSPFQPPFASGSASFAFASAP